MRFIWIALFLGGDFLAGCASSKLSFNKSRLLDATMDPAKTGVAVNRLQDQPSSLWEKSNTGSDASVGGSCPTCGT